MKIRYLLLTPALGLGFLLSALLLVSGSWAAPLLDMGPPVISPDACAHTVPVTTSISVTYGESIDAGTVSTQTFAVHAMETGLLTTTYDVDGGTISLLPANHLKPGELVQTTATTGTLSVGATEPVSSTVWQFRAAVSAGSGLSLDSGQSLGDSASARVALGDLDGDGDIDGFVANYDQPNKVWLNDGSGVFTDSGQDLGSASSWDVSLGDVDGDGDLDAFFANDSGQGNEVYLNNGSGAFSDSGQRLGSSDSQSVGLGDLDGDGDLDGFVANDGASKVWLNDGSGNFVDSGQSLGTAYNTCVSLGDLDGDGDLDAFMTRYLSDSQVWLNDGLGVFHDSGQAMDISLAWGVRLGDLDGDGDLDAFVASDLDEANTVWLNDDSAVFSDSGQALGGSPSTDVSLGDLDGDGDLDAFVANFYGLPNKIWLNDGSGAFTDNGQDLGSCHSLGMSLGDVDGDGDLDAFVANFGEANDVWLNAFGELTVTKTDRADPWYIGWNLGYDIVVTNSGDILLTGVVVTDTIPSPWTHLLGADFGASEKVWQIGDMRPGEVWRGEVVVRSLRTTPPETVITNTLRAMATQLLAPEVYTETTLLLAPPMDITPTPTTTATATPTATATAAATPSATPTATSTAEATTTATAAPTATSTPGATGSIEAMVWSDTNRDGACDPGEPGLARVRVELWPDVGGAVAGGAETSFLMSRVAHAFTGEGGTCLFVEVAAGDYVVREVDPEGYESTTDNEIPVTVIAGGTVRVGYGDAPEWYRTHVPLIVKSHWNSPYGVSVCDDDALPEPGVPGKAACGG